MEQHGSTDIVCHHQHRRRLRGNLRVVCAHTPAAAALSALGGGTALRKRDQAAALCSKAGVRGRAARSVSEEQSGTWRISKISLRNKPHPPLPSLPPSRSLTEDRTRDREAAKTILSFFAPFV